MADQKLRPMNREWFTSPVAMLDVIAYNIRILAAKASVDFEEAQTGVVFEGALGARPGTFKVKISGKDYEPVDGRVYVVLKSGEEASYEATADGYEKIEGKITPEGVNQVVYLPWAVAPAV